MLKIVGDGKALVAEAQALQPDLIIVDISMPLLNGIEAIQHVRKIHGRVKIVVLSMHSESVYATRAFRAGASGYVVKHAAPAELLKALRQVLKGRTYLSPAVSRRTRETGRLLHQSNQPERVLTPRQREVLQLVAEGRSAKEVAEVLHVSRRTIEFHKYRIMNILQLSTSAELIKYALQNGFISASEETRQRETAV